VGKTIQVMVVDRKDDAGDQKRHENGNAQDVHYEQSLIFGQVHDA
jgi:hypothetical protein